MLSKAIELFEAAGSAAPNRNALYHRYEAQTDLMLPLRILAKSAIPVLQRTPAALTDSIRSREMAAACEVFALAALTHRRPPFGITTATVGAREVDVVEEIAHATPFATLLHFRKPDAPPQPRVLIAAPMSGHFATLLRETVRTMLADHDVYVTDWHNARDVPLAAGRFGLDEYIEHLMDFMRAIGAGAHLVAICQPCVPALAAVALMAEDDDPAAPASLTLMAGPIDCRISPTEVNVLASTKPIAWFERHLIDVVPLRHAGALRRVYPGFVQLMAFMNMNLERHISSFRGLYEDLVSGNVEKAGATRSFYQEYFAVCDLPAEFYLQTVEHVFQRYALPRGRLLWQGRAVDPAAIRHTALVTVEGERDDICSLGQTLAAHDLCTSLRPFMRAHYVQPGAGHYGVFSGRRWQHEIYPVVRDAIHTAQWSAPQPGAPGTLARVDVSG